MRNHFILKLELKAIELMNNPPRIAGDQEPQDSFYMLETDMEAA